MVVQFMGSLSSSKKIGGAVTCWAGFGVGVQAPRLGFPAKL
jgi:hypothetical protein